MAVDLSQFHQVFFEESIEGLEVMESSLMAVDPQQVDAELINAVFRCAHSIKGGSATFGFTAVAEFTHVLETLLDQIRSNKRRIDASSIELFLQSVDCLREMLALLQSGQNARTACALELRRQFEALLNTDPSAIPTQASAASAAVAPQKPSDIQQDHRKTWHIRFVPGKTLLQSGNDPLRILKALNNLGDYLVQVDTSAVSALHQLNAEHIHLSWNIKLTTHAPEEDLKGYFDWVMDDSIVEMVEQTGTVTMAVGDAAAGERMLSWQIEFTPAETILRSGNDPVRVLRELKQNSSVWKVDADCSRIPALKLLDPELCHLSWQIQLSSSVDEDELRSIFTWVEDCAHIQFDLGAASQKNESKKSEIALDKNTTANAAPAIELSSAANPSMPAQSAEPADFSAHKNKRAANAEASSIRVGIDKIDNLINLVGELVITQSMLGQVGSDFDPSKIPQLLEGLSQLEQNTRELQENVMRIRMLPISFVFSRFPRMVRDLSQQLGKKVHLEMHGDQTELDKTVMEKIGDPLVHLVRNAVDHGMEMPDERLAAQKSDTGIISLNAYHQGGNVVIEISDDGKGLDRELILKKAIEKGLVQPAEANNMADEQVYDLIFQPGFSTAKAVTDVSGRGVGMDVVRSNIQALNGVVEIHSKKNLGTTIRIRLPLTLAILDGQLVRVGNNTYIVPLVSIVESILCQQSMVNHIAGGCSVFKLREDYVPIVRLSEAFAVAADNNTLERALLVVVEHDGEKIALVVDELMAQQQVVIKSLEQNYRRVEGISGATILGDGRVALIVDIPGLVKLAGVSELGRMKQSNLYYLHQQAV